MRATSSTSSSDRRVLALVRVAGALAAVAFAAVRFPSLGELLVVGRDRWGGDLFQLTRVSDFREPLPPERITPPEYGASPESTRTLLIGDSHSRFAREGRSLGEILHDSMPSTRAVAVTAIHPRLFDPSDLIVQQGIAPGRVRLVVWECAERTLADVALKKLPQPSRTWDSTWKFDMVQMARLVNDRWFVGSEAGYQFLLLNSWATRGLAEAWNTARFRVAGTLPSSIGAHTSRPPRLFLGEELAETPPPPGETPTSFLQVRDSALTESVAQSIAESVARLRKEHGADFVAVLVPAKASLHHAELGRDYDDFLPRVERALGRRGVRAIGAWEALSALGGEATLRSETHLSAKAYRILADSILAAAAEPLPRPDPTPRRPGP